MEPADQSPVIPNRQNDAAAQTAKAIAVEYLPDADEIEQRPLHKGVPITLYMLAGLLVIMVLWASFSEIDQVVTARGKLVTPLPNIVVQPMETVRIESMPVRIGEVVKKGQILATLDPTFATADLTQAKGRMDSLDAQTRRLQAELNGRKFAAKSGDDESMQSTLATDKQANYEARLSRLNESIGRLKAAKITNTQDITSLDARVKSLLEIEAMQEKLAAQQYQSRLKLLESRERRQEIERDLVVARHKDAELQRELAGAEAEKSAFVKEWRQKSMEELVTTRRERDAVAEQVNKADLRSRLVTMTSPVDAVVLEIAKRSVGSVVREAEPLFTLVPLDAELEAEIQIESDDIGYVKLADVTRVKIDAYPFQKHGLLTGAIRTLSEDAFTREPAQRQVNQRTDAYYLSRVGLGEIKFRNVTNVVRLLPGMTLTAEVVVGKRTVMSYFLYPMIRAMDEAIKEP